MRGRCLGAWATTILFAAITVGCHSEAAPAHDARSEAGHTAAIPAAELAKSYGLEVQPEVADGVPIRVVEAASGKPVGDALVVSVDESEFTYSDDQGGGVTWNSHTLIRKLGQAYATSSDGTIRVANPIEPCSIFVWHGDDFGRTTVEVHDREEHVVPVAPHSLLVEVVDKSGKPQSGVPIQIGKCALEPDSIGTTVGFTSVDGRFAIPPLELERGVHRTCGRRVLVMLGCPVSGIELRAVDAPRLEPVKFVLPDCGEVDVDLLDAKGRPLTRDSGPNTRLLLEVSSVRSAEDRGPDRTQRDGDERSIAIPIEGSSYRFEHVEIGTQLGFSLDVTNGSSESFDALRPPDAATQDPQTIPGPAKPGEVRHVVLRATTFGADEADPPSLVIHHTAAKEAKETTNEDSGGTIAPRDESSSLDIAIQLDVAIEPCWLSARLDDNQEPYDHESCPWIDVNGRATMREVPPGTHTVTITERRMSHEYMDVPICRIEDVVVGSGQHLRDPRLMNIDLRGKLRVHRLEIADDEGHPASGFVRFARDDDGTYPAPIWFEDGHVAFLTAVDDGLHASVAVNRCRMLELDLDSSEPAGRARRISMKRGIEVRLALAKEYEFPDAPHDPVSISVSEMPHWCETLVGRRTVELRKGADLDFRLAEPGEWRVKFYRTHDDGSGEATETEWNWVETTISVDDASGVQRIDLRPDRDSWDVLMKSLAR
jgi:hypothetical protein